MGKQFVIAAMVVTLTAGAPVFVAETGRADAQIGGCTCFAAVDAIDSDLRFVSRYYKSATLAGSGAQCAQACDSWRRDWFYRDACDTPTRINRGTNASWGYESGRSETSIGPATWWCPLPPP